MNRNRSMLIVLALQFFIVSTVVAGDFDWLPKLDITAKANLPGFDASLSTRFHIGDAQVKAVINSVEKPSDAYMVLRLGEISHQPTDVVIRQYQENRHKGWGALAKSLGIKPGSREFHALKAGHDLRLRGDDHYSQQSHGHGNKGKEHGNNGHSKGGGKHK